MLIAIYLVILILFGVLIFWVWNSTKDFEDNTKKISFITIGIIILGIITFIIFNISKIGIIYPNQVILREVRKVVVFLFIPINGFISLPHIAKIKNDIIIGENDELKNKRRIIILLIIIIVAFVFEIFYFKNFQDGIIQMLNSRKN